MRVKAAADDEQYRLITECRTSGLTDYQWCLKHDIKLGTFYGWVNRLRKAGAYNIPNAAKFPKAFGQEIKTPGVIPEYLLAQTLVMEIMLNGAAIRIPNGTDRALLECTIRMLREQPC